LYKNAYEAITVRLHGSRALCVHYIVCLNECMKLSRKSRFWHTSGVFSGRPL